MRGGCDVLDHGTWTSVRAAREIYVNRIRGERVKSGKDGLNARERARWCGHWTVEKRGREREGEEGREREREGNGDGTMLRRETSV